MTIVIDGTIYKREKQMKELARYLAVVEDRPFFDDLDDVLPLDAANAGYELTFIDGRGQYVNAMVLTKNGQLLYCWDSYEPSFIEIWDKVRELEALQ